MVKIHPKLILPLCIIITLLAVALKYAYQSFSYFTSIMLLPIMLTVALSNLYTRIFSAIAILMTLLALFIGKITPESFIAQILLAIVIILTTAGVFYIKKLYKTIKQEKEQMAVLIDNRKDVEERLIVQKDQLERITADMRRLNASLENKVEERTLILREALQELERSQVELSDALNKEKELNDIKSRFVSMASHEFRTPLSTILSSSALISKYPLTEDGEKREKHLRRIKDSVKHLNELLEDFLSIGKLEEGKVFTESEEFDAREFIQDIAEEMKAVAKEGQKIEFHYRGDNLFTTDKRLLKNILINLLSNAIKFSEERMTIYISALNSDGELNINIRDEGIGIPEEDKQHLFSTFFRGKNAVNIQGTGLGLNIVRRYVDLMGGNISVTSELKEGTTFHLCLPLLVNQGSLT